MEISIKWKICRVCLKENVSNMSDIYKLAENISECSGVVVNENDTLPDKICRACLHLLKYAVHFRKLCRSSDQYLQSVMRKTKSATDLLKREKLNNDDEFDLDLPVEYDHIFGEGSERKKADDCQVAKAEKETPSISTNPKRSTKHIINEQQRVEPTEAPEEEEYNETRGICTAEPQTKTHNLIELLEGEDVDEFQTNMMEDPAADQPVQFLEKYIEKIHTENDVDSYMQDGDIVAEDDGDDTEIDEVAGANNFMYSHDSDYNKEQAEDDEEGVMSKYEQDNDNLMADHEPVVYILKNDEIKQEGLGRYSGVGVVGETEDDSNLDPPSMVDVIQMDGNMLVDEYDDASQTDADEYNKMGTVEFLEEDADENLNSSSVVVHVTHSRNTKPSGKTTKAGSSGVRHKSNAKQHLSSTLKRVGDINVFICDLCGNHFPSRNLMSHHMRVHRNEKSFECELCSKRFNAACNLTAHMRVHTGEKPFQCQYCNRRFADRSTHIKHERIHTNEKPFTCSICGKSFALSTTLRAHEKVHTGEKPYRCDPCSKSFKLPHQLKAHLKTHLHKVLALEEQM